MKPLLKQIISNYDLLFGEQTKVSFSFRESSKQWLSGITLDERLDKLEQRIQELEKKISPREINFKQPSSFVGTVTYTIDLQVMEISLGGRIYNYCSVPQRIYESFEGAPSKGEYYNRNIKGQFLCS